VPIQNIIIVMGIGRKGASL